MPEHVWSPETEDARRALEGLAVSNADLALRELSSYRVAGKAALFAECHTHDDVSAVASAVSRTGVRTLVLGRGSKLLVADRGFDGLVVHLAGEFRKSSIRRADATVVTGGAANLQTFSLDCGKAGLCGLEWLEGVPGTAGGAVRMNAGCYENAMKTWVTSAEVIDLRTGAISTWSPGELRFEHRDSAIGSHHAVLEVRWKPLEVGSPTDSYRRRRELQRTRDRDQPPRKSRTAGSVFKTFEAWKWIRQGGAADIAVGCAKVAPKHSNFVEVHKSATTGANDVFEVMCRVRRQVLDRTGQLLEPETMLVGFTAEEKAALGLPAD